MPQLRELRFYGAGRAPVVESRALIAAERIRDWVEMDGGRLYFPTRWRAWLVDEPTTVFKFKTTAAFDAWLAEQAAASFRHALAAMKTDSQSGTRALHHNFALTASGGE